MKISPAKIDEAANLIESEIGEWGSIHIRLGDEYIDAMKVLIAASRAAIAFGLEVKE